MTSVRKKDLDEIKGLGQELKRIGSELQGYGMIGYGGTIKARAITIIEIVSRYEPGAIE